VIANIICFFFLRNRPRGVGEFIPCRPVVVHSERSTGELQELSARSKPNMAGRCTKPRHEEDASAHWKKLLSSQRNKFQTGKRGTLHPLSRSWLARRAELQGQAELRVLGGFLPKETKGVAAYQLETLRGLVHIPRNLIKENSEGTTVSPSRPRVSSSGWCATYRRIIKRARAIGATTSKWCSNLRGRAKRPLWSLRGVEGRRIRDALLFLSGPGRGKKTSSSCALGEYEYIDWREADGK